MSRLPSLSDEEIRHVEAEIKYEGYLIKQEKEIARIREIEGRKIPKGLDFRTVPGLTREAIEKMEKLQAGDDTGICERSRD